MFTRRLVWTSLIWINGDWLKNKKNVNFWPLALPPNLWSQITTWHLLTKDLFYFTQKSFNICRNLSLFCSLVIWVILVSLGGIILHEKLRLIGPFGRKGPRDLQAEHVCKWAITAIYLLCLQSLLCGSITIKLLFIKILWDKISTNFRLNSELIQVNWDTFTLG